jgi:hypothetical protein
MKTIHVWKCEDCGDRNHRTTTAEPRRCSTCGGHGAQRYLGTESQLKKKEAQKSQGTTEVPETFVEKIIASRRRNNVATINFSDRYESTLYQLLSDLGGIECLYIDKNGTHKVRILSVGRNGKVTLIDTNRYGDSKSKAKPYEVCLYTDGILTLL